MLVAVLIKSILEMNFVILYYALTFNVLQMISIAVYNNVEFPLIENFTP